MIMFSDHAHLPCRKRKYFTLITITTLAWLQEHQLLKYANHMYCTCQFCLHRQILQCFNIQYILKFKSNCFSHYHKYSKTVTWERFAELSHDMFMSESMLFGKQRVFQILLLGSLNTSSKTRHINHKAHILLIIIF
jgi:hypothetical protein